LLYGRKSGLQLRKPSLHVAQFLVLGLKLGLVFGAVTFLQRNARLLPQPNPADAKALNL